MTVNVRELYVNMRRGEGVVGKKKEQGFGLTTETLLL